MQKQNILTIIFSILLIFEMDAQITFQKTFGTVPSDAGYCIRQTIDGGFIICGNTSRAHGGNSAYDIYLIKIDSIGDTLWTKAYGGDNIEFGLSVEQTTDGGYIVAGYTWSFGAGDWDAYVIKTDVNGDTLWTKTYGGSDKDYAHCIRETSDGGFIFTGMTRSFGMGHFDVYMVKTDMNGNLLWTKTFGGADYDAGYSVEQTIDGGYIITGITASFGSGNDDIYLIKTDSIGNSVWKKAIGGISVDGSNFVQQTSDTGYIIAGYTYMGFGTGDYDAYVIKTDPNGNPLWTKAYGGIDDEAVSTVQETSDGGYIISGNTQSFGAGNSDSYLIRVDVNGDTLWTRTFGGIYYEGVAFAQQTGDGGYIMTGGTGSFGSGSNDVYLIKTDSNGYSGCNTGSTATIVTTVAAQVINPATTATSPASVVTIPAAIAGSGAIVTSLCTTVGINVIPADNLFLIFPNPVTDKLTVTTGNNDLSEIIIYDMASRKLLQQQFTNTVTLNTAQFAKGMYIYEVRNKSGLVKKGKVVKPACR